MLFENRQLTGRDDIVAEQQSHSPERFIIPEFPAFQNLGILAYSVKVVLGTVKGSDHRFLKGRPDIGRMLFENGYIAGQGQIVADKDTGPDGNPDGH